MEGLAAGGEEEVDAAGLGLNVDRPGVRAAADNELLQPDHGPLVADPLPHLDHGAPGLVAADAAAVVAHLVLRRGARVRLEHGRAETPSRPPTPSARVHGARVHGADGRTVTRRTTSHVWRMVARLRASPSTVMRKRSLREWGSVQINFASTIFSLRRPRMRLRQRESRSKDSGSAACQEPVSVRYRPQPRH